MTSDHYLVAGGNAIELLAQLAQGADKTLDGLDPKMASGFDRSPGKSGDLDVGKTHELLENRGRREKTARVRHALEVVLALLLQVIRLNEGGPASGRQEIREMPAELLGPVTPGRAIVRVPIRPFARAPCARTLAGRGRLP